MPKLPDEEATTIDQHEDTGFAAHEAGIFTGRLAEVSVSEQAGPSGFHQWLWKFDILDEVRVIPEPVKAADGTTSQAAPYTRTDAKIVSFMSLSPKATFKKKEHFDAFGVPANTDTDELIGRIASLRISKTKATQGKNIGKWVNNVEEVMPALNTTAATQGKAADLGDF